MEPVDTRTSEKNEILTETESYSHTLN